MAIDNQLLTLEADLENLNLAKTVVLERLLKDKIISKEQYTNYLEDWNIIIVKDSWFKEWFKKLKKDNPSKKDAYVIRYVNFSF